MAPVHARTSCSADGRSYSNPFTVFLRKRRHVASVPVQGPNHSTLVAKRHTCRSGDSSGVLFAEPPRFDEPPRKPTDAEARAVAAGAKFTPEQQLAKQLDLPATLRIKLPPGRPTDRQLMGQIQSAVTWKELEAVVYQQRAMPVPATATATAPPAGVMAEAVAAAAEPEAAVGIERGSAGAAALESGSSSSNKNLQEQLAQQQEQQQQQWQTNSQLPRQPPRRRQPPKPLSVKAQPASAPSLSPAAAAAGAAAAGTGQAVQQSGVSTYQQQEQQQQWQTNSQLPRQPPRRRQPPKSLSVAPDPAQQAPASAAAAATAAQPLAAPAAPAVAGMDTPSPLLNHLHVTEAIRRLVQLLPSKPGELNPADRTRAAAVIDFLTKQATAQVYNLEMDARGIAHISHGLAKLGHKDQTLIHELQEAAVLLIDTFGSQHVAMLLSALVGFNIHPNAQLLLAVQQHIKCNLHLFKHQSLANTIWAIARLSTVVGINGSTESGTPSSSSRGSSAETLDSSGSVAAVAGVPSGSSGSSAATLDSSGPAAADAGVPSGSSSSSSGTSSAETLDMLAMAPPPTAATGGIDPQLVADLMARCDPQMHFWTPVHLAQTIWGLGKLKAKPSDRFCKSLLKATQKQLPKMSPQDLANVITGLPELNAIPNQAWVDSFCTTAAAKMKFAGPLGIYSMLFGLAKVKQAQRHAQQEIEKRRQLTQQSTAAAQHHQPDQQAAADVDQEEPAEQPVQQQEELPAAAISGSHGEVQLTGPELKLLCAAGMWLQKLQAQLTQWQLAGVIIAMSQLLPGDIVQQAGAMEERRQHKRGQGIAEGLGSEGPAESAEQSGQAALGSHAEQQQQEPGPKGKEWVSDEQYLEMKRQRLITLLSKLIPIWREQQEQLHACLPVKRAGLFKVAWARLMQQYKAGSGTAAERG